MKPYKSPRGRLREEGARRILELRDAGRTLQSIATELGVSIGTVYNVVHGKTHTFIRDEYERTKPPVTP